MPRAAESTIPAELTRAVNPLAPEPRTVLGHCSGSQWARPVQATGCSRLARAALAGLIAGPASAAATGTEPDLTARSRWAATVGVQASYGPEYAGASQDGLRLQPGFALRWGRVSLASRSAFAVRGGDPGARGGLRVELLRSERWRSNLGLRWDSGRDEGASEDLRGLGDVRGTLRARGSIGYRFDAGWRAGAALSTDVLGRGGGWQGEISAGRDLQLSPRTGIGASLSLSFGGTRWQQNHFGITPAQAARSAYPVYTPGRGLRDLTLSFGGRTELGARWALFYSASAARLLSPAAGSPLVREVLGYGLSTGLVYRFGPN